MSRLRLIAGILMLVLGAAVVVMSVQVLSTFLLEIVVGTLDAGGVGDVPPYDFSWGTMEWGNMTRDFSAVCVGLVLIGIGQFLLVPPAVLRAGSNVQRTALIGAAVMTLIAGASYFLVPFSTMRVFGMLAESGVADPVFMGEQMPICAGRVFAGCLVVAQVLLIVAAVATGRAGDDGSTVRPAGRLLLVRVACTCLLLFGLAIVLVRLGPVRMLADVGTVTTASDPAEIARVISQALRMMLCATPLVLISGILILIASLLPGRRGDVS